MAAIVPVRRIQKWPIRRTGYQPVIGRLCFEPLLELAVGA
jgi:hypothetical protein